MKRLVIALLSVAALAFAAPAAADPPTAIQFVDVFPDVNPCTAETHTVTIARTTFLHHHDSRLVGRSERTITTSSGFAGRGVDSFVENGQVIVFHQTDILTNASGDRIRAHTVSVLDVSTGTERVGTFELTCLGP